MDNARNLFEKISLEYINESMLGKDFENNWLECKQKSDPLQGALDEGDKSNFAKALSGFANTSGGVLLFGVDARKKDGVDCIISTKPINGLKRFESEMREAESRLVEKAIVGVEYKSLLADVDAGILAVLVPESQRMPHRSMKDHKFYIRAGGVFVSADLNTIQDLFSRRLRPSLSLDVNVQANQYMIHLINDGEATAKDPYVVIKLPDHIHHTNYELDGNSRLTSWVWVNTYNDVQGSYVIFQNGANRPIHPHSRVPLLQLRSGRSAQHEVPAVFEFHIYAENMERVDGTFICRGL